MRARAFITSDFTAESYLGRMRDLVAYLLVVGTPLLGLLGVLRVGERVRAPVAVHGAYVLHVGDPSWAQAQPCLRYLLSGSDSTLHITQAGAQLAATLGPEGNVSLRGELTRDTVRLAGAIEAAAMPDSVRCAQGDSLSLLAVATRDNAMKRLHGALVAASCTACGAIQVSAERPRGYAGRRRS